MNPGVKDLRKAFRGDQYRVMIVANKFQTGFDQPLLCAMYVDRLLVRGDRRPDAFAPEPHLSHPRGVSKTAAMTQIVDFVNEPALIQAAFTPYYTDAFLETATDPNLVHDLSSKLDTAGIYTQPEIDQAADAWVKGKGNNALKAAIGPGQKRFADRYKAALLAQRRRGRQAGARRARHVPQGRRLVRAALRLHVADHQLRRPRT